MKHISKISAKHNPAKADLLGTTQLGSLLGVFFTAFGTLATAFSTLATGINTYATSQKTKGAYSS